MSGPTGSAPPPGPPAPGRLPRWRTPVPVPGRRIGSWPAVVARSAASSDPTGPAARTTPARVASSVAAARFAVLSSTLQPASAAGRDQRAQGRRVGVLAAVYQASASRAVQVTQAGRARRPDSATAAGPRLTASPARCRNTARERVQAAAARPTPARSGEQPGGRGQRLRTAPPPHDRRIGPEHERLVPAQRRAHAGRQTCSAAPAAGPRRAPQPGVRPAQSGRRPVPGPSRPPSPP